MRCVYPLFQPLQTFAAVTLFSCSPRALFTASIRILSNRFGEVLFTAVQEGIRGAQRSPEGQWGRTERDTWFPWQPDRMEPLKLRDVMFEIWKDATVFSLNCISNFLIFGFYYLFSSAGIFMRLLLIAQHLHSRLGMEMCSLHYFATLMCSAFNIWWLRSGEKKIKNYLYFYKYDSIMTGYICRHFHARCMLKLSPKIPGSQLCKHKRRCLMWVRGLRAHRRTGVPRLFIWVVVWLQEWPRALI